MLADLERRIADLAEAAAECDSVEAAMATVLVLSQFRRSVTFALDEWRAREAALIAEKGGHVDVGQNATATVRPKMRFRFDHGYIGRTVARLACRDVDDDGEVFPVDGERAAANAVEMMMELYVSPASEPKKTALVERLGFETWKQGLASAEEVGKEVKVRAK